ncbi:MAG TPA: DUF4912 domain-containing protein [Dissulfurispiraceae bacterium]
MKAIKAPAAKKEIRPIPEEKPKRAVRNPSPKPKTFGAGKAAVRPAPVPVEEGKIEPAGPASPPEKMPKAAGEKTGAAVPAPPAQAPAQLEEMPIADEPFPEPRTYQIEYEGDKVVSMPVTPRRLYVYWEISEETMAGRKGSFNIKITDIRANSFFYMPISERIGEYFITVSPEGEYAIEVGLISRKGEFVNLAQLQQPGQPAVPVGEAAGNSEKTEEGGRLPEEFFEPPESITSY